MTRPMIPGAQPWFSAEDRLEIQQRVMETLDSGILTQGPNVLAFEEACRSMAGTRHAIAVNSGGSALQLALEALNLQGGEVIVPTQTFVASPNSVVRAGGAPVFSDIDPATMSPTLEQISSLISPRTVGVMLVHMFGLISPQIIEIRDYCKNKGLFLLEDAAHAHGATQAGLRAGGIGIAGCFSYYATKILTTGEGGVITTNDDGLADTIRSLRNHGRTKDKETYSLAGNNFRLDEISAAMGVVQHGCLEKFLIHRRQLASIYRSKLGNVKGASLVDSDAYDGHAYWRYSLILSPEIDRIEVRQKMAEEAGARVTWMYAPLCHLQPAYIGSPRLPVGEDVCSRLINLPIHMGVSLEDAGNIADHLISILADLSQ